jgi:hypothetical protein
MTDTIDMAAQRMAAELENYGEFQSYFDEVAAELRRLHHNNEVLMNALWKACGDDAQVVEATIESQGELK